MTPIKITIFTQIIESSEEGEYSVNENELMQMYFFVINAVNLAIAENGEEYTQIHSNSMIYTSPWPLKKVLNLININTNKYGTN